MKTAVEWFYQRILAEDIKAVFEQAKEMEKAERAKEYLNGFKDGKEYMKKIQTFESK